jgi:hypothetical protein
VTHKLDHHYDHVLSVEGVMRLGPCKDNWPRSKVEEWFGDRKTVLLSDALRSRKIQPFDKGWLFANVTYYKDAYPVNWVYANNYKGWLRDWHKKQRDNGRS